MDYYTNYELNYDKELDHEKLVNDLNSVTGYLWNFYLELPDVKWYDWKDNMREISKMYPDVLFELEGIVEEQGDHWIAYVKNGKVQIARAKITFEPFDEWKMV